MNIYIYIYIYFTRYGILRYFLAFVMIRGCFPDADRKFASSFRTQFRQVLLDVFVFVLPLLLTELDSHSITFHGFVTAP